MHEIFKSHHPKRQLSSFRYASQGIRHAVLNEANFRVQLLFTIISFSLGLYFGLSTLEWMLVAISNGMLLSAEIMNTVIEEFIDHLIQEHHEGVKIIKDMSAGFVFINAIVALIVFLLIFVPRIPF